MLSRWFERLSDDDQAKVLTRLEYLGAKQRGEWKRPYFDILKGMDGMGEIRFNRILGVQTRLIGYFGPNRKKFTVVLVVTKKQNIYSPKQWEKTALQRKKESEKGGASKEWYS